MHDAIYYVFIQKYDPEDVLNGASKFWEFSFERLSHILSQLTPKRFRCVACSILCIVEPWAAVCWISSRLVLAFSLRFFGVGNFE